MAEYKKVKIERGPGGWGGPLEVKPSDEKKYVVCITGGGIHPVAQKIADMTGAEPFDGFKSSPCLLYTSPSPRDATLSRMPSSA